MIRQGSAIFILGSGSKLVLSPSINSWNCCSSWGSKTKDTFASSSSRSSNHSFIPMSLAVEGAWDDKTTALETDRITRWMWIRSMPIRKKTKIFLMEMSKWKRRMTKNSHFRSSFGMTNSAPREAQGPCRWCRAKNAHLIDRGTE